MRSTLRPVLVLAAILAAPFTPAGATTYLEVSDEALTAKADLVVEARVVEATPGAATGMPSTDYRVEVERVVAGSAPGTTLVVNVPGGVRPDGKGLQLWGVPQFGAGERVLLFLGDNGDGSYRITHLALGTFRPELAGERTLAVRDLADAHVMTRDGKEPVEGTRDLERFTAWVADRARGERRAADYWVAADGMRPLTAEFTHLRWNNRKIRWFEFDAGQRVQWRAHRSGQGGVPGEGFADFSTAIGVWNGDGGSNVGYDYVGQTSATGGLNDFDGVNAILFGVTLDSDFDCNTGGVLAVGGPWFDDEDTATYNGEVYIKAGGADIMTNRGLDCFFASSPSPNLAAQELFGHELGHTLGLGHSCGDSRSGTCDSLKGNALMRATIHDDGRGARLNDDDRAGIRSLYTPAPGGGGKVPRTPATATATPLSATSVRVRWDDRSGNEKHFHVEQRVGAGGTFAEVGVVGANVETFTVTGLTPSTSYGFRVRATNDNGSSGYSNVASATTPADLPAKPTNLRADHTGTAIVLSWVDRSTNETGFAIEAKSPQQATFTAAATAAADTQSFSLGSLPPGVPFTFRVRALGPGGNSGYSNEASATIAETSACAPSAVDLCLGAGNRFRVRVSWRANGSPGAGGAISDGNPTTGFFWFFDPANIELAVKVVDGTSLNDFFWTFYGALSDVEYWITVADTVTLESRTYHNPQGSVVGQADTSSLPAAASSDPLPLIPAPSCAVQTPVDAVAAPGVCVPGAETLCLHGGRFQVEVAFQSGGVTGEGTAIPFAGDQSGRFWFFGADNTELLVKVLDGRGLNGRYWVFYGALSDVQYTVSVTDVITGKVRRYSNSQGNVCGRADTAAFLP